MVDQEDGYEFPADTFDLTFSEGKFAGLKVVCVSGSIAQYRALDQLDPTAGRDAYLVGLCNVFAESLVSWNLRRRGKPVPPTLDGLLHQDPLLVTTIVNTWLDAFIAQRRRDDEADEAEQLLAQLPHEVMA